MLGTIDLTDPPADAGLVRAILYNGLGHDKSTLSVRSGVGRAGDHPVPVAGAGHAVSWRPLRLSARSVHCERSGRPPRFGRKR
jgi:hypothetical protein